MTPPRGWSIPRPSMENLDVAQDGIGSGEKPRIVGTREDEAWRAYFERSAVEEPRFSFGVHYLRNDVAETMARAIPRDARVLEVGSGPGDTLARLPNAVRDGVDPIRKLLSGVSP